jgi:S-adenosylmethionine:tRNA ribosyltransferase-isomerase
MANITFDPAEQSNERLLFDLMDFALPCELQASEPPEARGLRRDEVRLMVSYRATDKVLHKQFNSITDVLTAGDVLVINTSGTMNAAINGNRRSDQQRFEIHLSTKLPANLWVVEVRQPDTDKHSKLPYYSANPGETYDLPNRATITLLTPHHSEQRQGDHRVRLWIASLSLPQGLTLPAYLADNGFPIRYNYVKQGWSNDYYQTVYATEMGSAEMPSAGRAFTPEVITRLTAKGVQVVPLILHTGVASQENHEPPYEEYYRVPVDTARIITEARQAGRRIIAVGTTVVRALETVTQPNGITYPGEGWTETIITPDRGIRAVNGMLTGLHEPKATHLAMLEALAGIGHLQQTYREAIDRRYLWHEFGDLHLILP